jgi:hypothetical protein
MYKKFFNFTLNNLIGIIIKSKPIRNIILRIYGLLWNLNFNFKKVIYKTYVEKDNIIYINPEKIRYEQTFKSKHWRFFLLFIKPLFNFSNTDKITLVDGDWDLPKNLKLFNESIKYRSFYQHFIQKLDWERTEYYKKEEINFVRGRVRKEYNSRKELNRKYEYLEILFNNINKKGYKTQRELLDLEDVKRKYGFEPKYRRLNDEITVAIGRSNEIIFLDGRHRLSIAKLLHLKSIPVKVLIYHSNWVKNKNEVAKKK